jgi:hypothetical protein
MGMSSGVLFGVVMVLQGGVFYFGMRQKGTAAFLLGVGAAMILLTLGMIVLAANSDM